MAQPAIGREFAAGPGDVGWVVFGYSATFAIGTAVWGGVASRFGSGRALAVGIVLFVTGSAVAAFAPSLPSLVVARLVQGVGSGAIPTLSTALIARHFDGTDRARALGVIVAAVGTGLAVGPLLGGSALQLFGWRAAVAFGVVALPAAWLVFRAEGASAGARHIDVPGAGLVSIVILAATFLMNRLPVLGVVPLTVTALVALVIGAFAYVLYIRSRPDAIVPWRVLGNPSFYRLAGLGGIGMSAFLGTLVTIPVAASRAHGLDGIALGLLLVPMAFVAAVSSLQNARVQAVIGRSRTTTLALGALAITALPLALLGAEAPPPVLAVCLLPLGLGFGLLGAPLVNELTRRFSGPDQPIAVGAYNLVFFLGGSLGAAITSGLLQTGLDLPALASAVPGFRTAELLLSLAPTIAAVFLVASRIRAPRRTA